MKNTSICLLIFVCMFSFQTQITAQNSQQLFQQGMIQEEAEGDLKAAITIYNKIVNNVSVDRNLRAKALLQVGICYEKLGNQNARKTYQKLIAEYSDQEVIVAIGLQKLRGLKKSVSLKRSEGIIASQIWSPAQDTYGVSPDGRYLNYIDWNTISINVKDILNGTTRIVSKEGTWKASYRSYQFPGNSIWSPDGKQLAYYWYDGNKTELHIVNPDGSNNKIIARGVFSRGPRPVTWTRDGKYILTYMEGKPDGTNKNQEQKIVLLSVSDGTTKDLKLIERLDFGGHIDMSPNGKYIVYTLNQNEHTAAKDIYILSMDGSVDKKLVGNLANDTDPKWSPDGKEILFMSNRYGSHDLWSLKIKNGQPIGVAEIVKANFGDRNNLHGFTNEGALYYSISNFRSDIYTLNLDENSRNDYMKPYKISTLQEKMNQNPMWSPDGRYICYYRWQKFRHDVLRRPYNITIYDTKTGKVQNIKTNIYGDRNTVSPTWSHDGKKLLFHGRIKIKEELQLGYFIFNINSKKITPIKSTDGGLFRTRHTFSNDDKSIFTLTEDRKRIIKIDINSKKETTIFTGKEEIYYFKLSNDNNKIAYNYAVNNINDLYVVSTTGGDSKKILSADNGTTPYIIHWSKNDEFLYFLERKYGGALKIMQISVDGGSPEQFVNVTDAFSSGTVRRVKMHPDGKRLVVTLNVGKREEVWKLEGIFNE